MRKVGESGERDRLAAASPYNLPPPKEENMRIEGYLVTTKETDLGKSQSLDKIWTKWRQDKAAAKVLLCEITALFEKIGLINPDKIEVIESANVNETGNLLVVYKEGNKVIKISSNEENSECYVVITVNNGKDKYVLFGFRVVSDEIVPLVCENRESAYLPIIADFDSPSL